MQYHYASDCNFEDFSSGRFFYARPGQPAFPVRLASEIFQRGLHHWRAAGGQGACTLYDPVCGGAYWLVVLAYLHWKEIAAIYASDIDSQAIALAERNLSLLGMNGFESRVAKIEALISKYGKESHRHALESAQKFHQQLKNNLLSHSIPTFCFVADATNIKSLRQGLNGQHFDIILADVPYGWHSKWTNTEGRENLPVQEMLGALHPYLHTSSVLAVVADKRQTVRHEKYQRVELFQAGRRRIVLLRIKNG